MNVWVVLRYYNARTDNEQTVELPVEDYVSLATKHLDI